MKPSELLFSITKKDLDISYFSGTGAGGQYRNKHQNCVRMIHRDSGASATGQSNRNRTANLKEAFKGLISSARFKVWHAKKVYETLTGESVEQRVEDAMASSNIKVETRNARGTWEAI